MEEGRILFFWHSSCLLLASLSSRLVLVERAKIFDFSIFLMAVTGARRNFSRLWVFELAFAVGIERLGIASFAATDVQLSDACLTPNLCSIT
mmetsp:Transcript_56050/g.87236  ORF Transcript_56050/g.87236 Transcript_56050/m.87236 type:complete len:92 (+) Transcript_56050:1902-2177(+)